MNERLMRTIHGKNIICCMFANSVWYPIVDTLLECWVFVWEKHVELLTAYGMGIGLW